MNPQPSRLYTLHSKGACNVPSYIVGPKPLRRKIEANVFRKEHDLTKARDEHEELVAMVNSLSLSPSTSSEELSRMKKLKLRAKDKIVALMRETKPSHHTDEHPTPSPSLKEIGFGGYGKVFFGTSLDDEQNVAIKIATLGNSMSLWKEYLVLCRLEAYEGFGKVQYYGKQNIVDQGVHVVMVMDWLGPSIEKLFQMVTLGTRGFRGITVLKIAEQLVQRLRILSAFNIVHGDVQPGNFLMGRSSSAEINTVYLIDFGMARLSSFNENSTKSAFRGAFTPPEGESLEYHNENCNVNMMGTLAFSSIAAMKGENLYERDDLESLAYSLAYLLCNKLPWLSTEQDDALDGTDVSDKINSVLKSKSSIAYDQVILFDLQCIHLIVSTSPDVSNFMCYNF